MIIENLENPADSKIIRVTLEVVAKQNIKRSALSTIQPAALGDLPSNRVFDVYTHGVAGKDSAVAMGDVCLGSFYTARSLIICNRESVPLEFSVKSNLSADSDTELIFSLSRTSARLFKNVTIEPESHAKIYLRFWPGNAGGSLRCEAVRDINLEIYVNCRLVKDYQMR
jgi:hypothetical protein